MDNNNDNNNNHDDDDDDDDDDIRRSGDDALVVVRDHGAATIENGTAAASEGTAPRNQQQSSNMEEEDDDLERKVEAINREEAAVTPVFQRTVGFTSTPGAFRASPSRGLRRAGADDGGVASTSVISMMGDSTVSRSGGGLPPPIEAILVDTQSTRIISMTI
jgi:hypothetical protein